MIADRFFTSTASSKLQQPLARAVDSWKLADGTHVSLRPVKPQDALQILDFVAGLSSQSRLRWFRGAVKGASTSLLTRPAQMDWERHVALVATITERGEERVIADARFVIDEAKDSAEFALVVADRWQRRGVDRRAMSALCDAARRRGLLRLNGNLLDDNTAMLCLMQRCGFNRMPHPDEDGVMRVEKILQPLRGPEATDEGWFVRMTRRPGHLDY
jgi:acetyltransferase